MAMLPADDHVHSEWSYDTGATASMVRACERALSLGVPSVAFTEHLDFAHWQSGDQIGDAVAAPRYRRKPVSLDIDGYHRCVAECRERFPDLKILSGVEIGEPHMYEASVKQTLARGPFDRILGSLHAIVHEREMVGVGELFCSLRADDVVRRYFAELERLVVASSVFQVLAHVDFPRRYWPSRAGAFVEADFEEEYRSVFRTLADTDRTLEINTRSPLASVELMRWWREEGGRTVSFGSDAHVPDRVGESFELAVDIVEAAGFKPGADRFDFWRR